MEKRDISNGIMPIGGYEVSVSTREVFHAGERVSLPWRCFEAFKLLIEARGEIVSREELFQRLWPGTTVDESSLNHCMARLRKALGEPAATLIETVPGRGYRLSEPAHLRPVEAATLCDPQAPVPDPPAAPTFRRPTIRIAAAAAILSVAAIGLVAVPFWKRLSNRDKADGLVRDGFEMVRKGRRPFVVEANRLFQRALELDPKNSRAYAGLAEGMARSGEDRPGAASEMALLSLRLDPQCAECRTIAGWILLTREWKFQDALHHLEQAVQQNPPDARAHLWLSQVHAVGGRVDEAKTEIDRSLQLQPGSAAALAMRAGILYFLEQYPEAIVAAKDALSVQPDYSGAWDWIYRSYMAMERVEEALSAHASRDRAYSGESLEWEWNQSRRLIESYHNEGLTGAVHSLLARTASKPALDIKRYERAVWRMWIGDQSGALDELEHLPDFRPFHSIYLAVDPVFKPLHSEPRFQNVLARIGLDWILRRESQSTSSSQSPVR